MKREATRVVPRANVCQSGLHFPVDTKCNPPDLRRSDSELFNRSSSTAHITKGALPWRLVVAVTLEPPPPARRCLQPTPSEAMASVHANGAQAAFAAHATNINAGPTKGVSALSKLRRSMAGASLRHSGRTTSIRGGCSCRRADSIRGVQTVAPACTLGGDCHVCFFVHSTTVDSLLFSVTLPHAYAAARARRRQDRPAQRHRRPPHHERRHRHHRCAPATTPSLECLLNLYRCTPPRSASTAVRGAWFVRQASRRR